MLARKTCCGDPNAGIATRFPLRSRTARICPVANSSKQPTCRPPKKTTGSPASTRRMDGAENWLLMSMAPEANRGFGSAPPDASSLRYCTSVKPSAVRSSSATNCGAMQRPVQSYNRIRVVSNGASSARAFEVSKSPATAADERPVRKRRRFCMNDIFRAPYRFRVSVTSNGRARMLNLQLALDLVEETPVRSLGDDLVGGRLDHARFAQTQRIEPDRVLGIVVPPLRVWDLLHVSAHGCYPFSSRLSSLKNR